MRRLPVGAAVVLVVLGGLGAWAATTAPAAPAPPRGEVLAVRSRTVVCPALAVSGPSQRSAVWLASDGGRAGSVTTNSLAGPAATRQVAVGATSVVAVPVPATGALVVRVAGPLAAGLVADELSVGAPPGPSGVSAMACRPVAGDQWFVGAGTQVGEDPEISLVNPGSVPAVVNIEILTPAGLAADPGGQGLLVAPGARLRLALASLAPGVATTAVGVLTESGTVAAAIEDVRADGSIPRGLSWVPVAQAKGARQVVPGVPGFRVAEPFARTLVLANPGALPVTARVRLATAVGQFVPTGGTAVVVPAKSVRTMGLAALGGNPAAVTVTGTGGALLAGVVLATVQSGPGAVAFLSSSPPLAPSTVLPALQLPPSSTPVGLFSAPFAAAHVVVGPFTDSAGAAGRSVRVALPAGHSLAVPLPGLASGSGGVRVQVSGGPVYLAVVISGRTSQGPLLAALTPAVLPQSYRAPPVVGSPTSADG